MDDQVGDRTTRIAVHTALLILAIVLRAVFLMAAAPVRALGDIVEVLRDKAIDPLEDSLDKRVAEFRGEAYAPKRGLTAIEVR